MVLSSQSVKVMPMVACSPPLLHSKRFARTTIEDFRSDKRAQLNSSLALDPFSILDPAPGSRGKASILEVHKIPLGKGRILRKPGSQNPLYR